MSSTTPKGVTTWECVVDNPSHVLIAEPNSTPTSV